MRKISITTIGTGVPGTMQRHVSNWPIITSEPVPAPQAVSDSFKSAAPNGPNIALDIIEGIRISGLLSTFGNCTTAEPKPCANTPPSLLSRYPETANPTMLQHTPIVAAPAATPESPSDMASAGRLSGITANSENRTATTIPPIIGEAATLQLARPTIQYINLVIYGVAKYPTSAPDNIEANGVNMRLKLVFCDISIPISMAIQAAINAPSGSPEFPSAADPNP